MLNRFIVRLFLLALYSCLFPLAGLEAQNAPAGGTNPGMIAGATPTPTPAPAPVATPTPSDPGSGWSMSNPYYAGFPFGYFFEEEGVWVMPIVPEEHAFEEDDEPPYPGWIPPMNPASPFMAPAPLPRRNQRPHYISQIRLVNDFAEEVQVGLAVGDGESEVYTIPAGATHQVFLPARRAWPTPIRLEIVELIFQATYDPNSSPKDGYVIYRIGPRPPRVED